MREARLAWLVLVACVLTAWALVALRPVAAAGSAEPRWHLNALAPERIGAWRLADDQAQSMPQALLDKTKAVYDQTLERVYEREDGTQVMLSLAYGSNQGGDALQVHRPEYCYVDQGFQIVSAQDSRLNSAGQNIPVRHLVAQKGARTESITYWITVGNQAQIPGWRRKVAMLIHGLRGEVPDGLLVRISSLQADSQRAYGVHADFVESWQASLNAAERLRLGLGGPMR